MTTQSRTYRGSAPSNLGEWLIVLRIAGMMTARMLLLITAVCLLAWMRSGVGPEYKALIVALSVGALYAALGRGARTWAVYIVGFALFAELRSYADNLGMPVHYQYAISLEKLLFFGTIPTVWLQDRLYTFAQTGPVEAYTITVYLSYFFVPHAVALALWRWDPERFKPYALGFLVTLYLGLAFCAIVPTAPPWLAGQTGDIPHVFQVIPDIAGEVTPGAYDNAYAAAGSNPVAAMPSLHAAIPWLMAMALWKYRRLRTPALLYALSMSFAIVYLGEHYVVDAIAGLATAAIGWLLARQVLGLWEGRRQRGDATAVQPPAGELRTGESPAA